MKAVVVYESLWGHTAAIARAVAEGIGRGATALSTSEASASSLEGADLVVAGAPVHLMRLPSAKSREKAKERGERPGALAPDLDQLPMVDWLAGLARAHAAGAAFDTRVSGQPGGAASARISKGLARRGYPAVAKPERFFVERVEDRPGPDVTLREGEMERAREWGASLARAVRR